MKVVPGLRGIVFTSPSRWLGNMIQSVAVLRDLGCTLPIQLSYVEGQLSDTELEKARSFNISTVDISRELKKYSWGDREMSLGGPKVDSIIASPFEQVLFLDPDVMPLRDPTYLFDSNRFKKYGALIWGDTMKRGSRNALWKVMELEGKYREEMEFESGQMLFDKSKVWKGLMMAKHLSSEAKYYFNHFWGDKETFHWGFRAIDLPYYLNPQYLQVVGVLVDDAHPAGGAMLTKLPTEPPTYKIPDGSKFCGIAMLQLDFYDGPESDAEAELAYKGKPLFMHGNGLKYTFHAEVQSFQVAMTYVPPKGKFVHNFDGMFHDWIGNYKNMEHCIGLVNVRGLDIKVWDWESENPGFSDMYREAHRIGFSNPQEREKIIKSKEDDKVHQEKWISFMKTVDPYDAEKLGIKPGSRGVVLTGSERWADNVVMAALFLRELGCNLPVSFAYIDDQIGKKTLDKLSVQHYSCRHYQNHKIVRLGIA
ncbi:mannosyltransferase putative-domain-containing protein [Zopfochytrium polystomum]|nr:mannosyltransferase putative-domain-containing protein [Zopfochytrium polystomum]